MEVVGSGRKRNVLPNYIGEEELLCQSHTCRLRMYRDIPEPGNFQYSKFSNSVVDVIWIFLNCTFFYEIIDTMYWTLRTRWVWKITSMNEIFAYGVLKIELWCKKTSVSLNWLEMMLTEFKNMWWRYVITGVDLHAYCIKTICTWHISKRSKQTVITEICLDNFLKFMILTC